MKQLRAISVFAVALLWVGLSVWSWVKPADDISTAERRKLTQIPVLDRQSWTNGSFTTDFESYTTDQFPLREEFRGLKSHFGRRLLLQKDMNGIYFYDGYAAQLQYPLDEASLAHACSRLDWIYHHYLMDTNCHVYLSIVPDKHYFLAEMGGYPSLDYAALFSRVQGQLSWADMIDLSGSLTLEDYYRLDTHWRQEQLLPAADVLCERFGIPLASGQAFRVTAIDVPFYGVYRGQMALNTAAETLYVLQSPVLDGCQVFNYETNRYGRIYDESKYTSRDLYDVYLSGATALLRIDNPVASTERELIVFRDSFGSSMIPLLVHGYKTITVVDIRYISPQILGNFLEFQDQDVLFLYSTILLNNSAAMK